MTPNGADCSFVFFLSNMGVGSASLCLHICAQLDSVLSNVVQLVFGLSNLQIPGLPALLVMQAQGKFDLKEPYYRQLNPQAAAAAVTGAWPQQQEQTEHAGQAMPHQQHGYMERGQGSAEMQAATEYAWANQHQTMQQQPGLVPQNSSQQHLANQWNQHQNNQQSWQ